MALNQSENSQPAFAGSSYSRHLGKSPQNDAVVKRLSG
jgi:hypothetical protein